MHKQGLPSLMDVCVMCSELLANLVDLSKTQPDYRWVVLEPRIFVSILKCIKLTIHSYFAKYL